ncbi:hypothetical protein MIR68_001553 [Amoeboaphelidium protococcarum]|nr:hypothetical protein MIR68_001553 [Amoeboaphelidium protococcarum]
MSIGLVVLVSYRSASQKNREEIAQFLTLCSSNGVFSLRKLVHSSGTHNQAAYHAFAGFGSCTMTSPFVEFDLAHQTAQTVSLLLLSPLFKCCTSSYQADGRNVKMMPVLRRRGFIIRAGNNEGAIGEGLVPCYLIEENIGVGDIMLDQFDDCHKDLVVDNRVLPPLLEEQFIDIGPQPFGQS